MWAASSSGTVVVQGENDDWLADGHLNGPFKGRMRPTTLVFSTPKLPGSDAPVEPLRWRWDGWDLIGCILWLFMGCVFYAFCGTLWDTVFIGCIFSFYGMRFFSNAFCSAWRHVSFIGCHLWGFLKVGRLSPKRPKARSQKLVKASKLNRQFSSPKITLPIAMQ